MERMNLTPPFLICTDSYKATHPKMFPKADKMVAYGEFRKPLTPNDQRIVIFGLRYAMETILNRQITWKDIEEADAWYATHGVGKTSFYYPRDLWISVIEENDGRIPLDIFALPDGSVVYPHVPVYVIEAHKKYARLVTWFETLLTHMWSPTTTATKSAQVKDFLRGLFEKTVDPADYFLLMSRLHDFGFRGVSSLESAMVTGAGHLLSFEGTDTMPAGWLATQFNEGRPVGESVWATEHSVMLSWDSELSAIRNTLLEVEEGSLVSIVSDTYDYEHMLTNLLPEVVDIVRERNLMFIIRPDSGDPVECVLRGLRASAQYFGYHENEKGYKVLHSSAVIQGDGIDMWKLMEIAESAVSAGFSIQNVAFGMGGGLLQKQNRDTLSMATKLSGIVYDSGRQRLTMKVPKTDRGKFSMPGRFRVYEDGGSLVVSDMPLTSDSFGANNLRPIWRANYKDLDLALFRKNAGGTFDEMRQRLEAEWARRPKVCDPIGPTLRELIENQIKLERSR